jgi:hypothetical protein
VTEDVTYNFDIGSGIDLSACVTVPKCVGSNLFRCNARPPGVVPDTVPNGRTGDGLIGHVFAQENEMN